jgi:hypothetical protein
MGEDLPCTLCMAVVERGRLFEVWVSDTLAQGPPCKEKALGLVTDGSITADFKKTPRAHRPCFPHWMRAN